MRHSSHTQEKKLKIGDYEICPLPTGIFGLDGGAMFGTVPKILWEKSNPPDEKNRIKMEARGLLLKGTQKKIVIDCGNGSDFIPKYGEKLGSKFAELYNINGDGPSLTKSLHKYGVDFSDITDVILTHLHFDHAGGATRDIGGKIDATFPKAQYYVQKENLETANHPNIREKASYLNANFQPLLDMKKLKLLDGEQEVLPGIRVIISNGHTKGQQVVKITDGISTMLYCGDLIPTSSHVRLAWIMGYDLDPLTLIEEKRKVLTQAAAEGWYLFFEHDPYCDAATIEANGSDFQVKNRFWL